MPNPAPPNPEQPNPEQPTPEQADPAVAQHSVELALAPSGVWQLLTDSAAFASWYAYGGAEIDPEPGGALALSWEADEVFHGRVEQADRPTRFSYRLAHETGLDPTPTNSTLVQFLVTESPTGAGSTLTVRESGFADLDPKYHREFPGRTATMAWTMCLGMLANLVNTPTPPAD